MLTQLRERSICDWKVLFMPEISFLQVSGISLQNPWFKGRSSRLLVKFFHRLNLSQIQSSTEVLGLLYSQHRGDRNNKEGKGQREESSLFFLYLNAASVRQHCTSTFYRHYSEKKYRLSKWKWGTNEKNKGRRNNLNKY